RNPHLRRKDAERSRPDQVRHRAVIPSLSFRGVPPITGVRCEPGILFADVGRTFSADPSERLVVVDSGLGRTGRPGMTTGECLRLYAREAISRRHAPFV